MEEDKKKEGKVLGKEKKEKSEKEKTLRLYISPLSKSDVTALLWYLTENYMREGKSLYSAGCLISFSVIILSWMTEK